MLRHGLGSLKVLLVCGFVSIAWIQSEQVRAVDIQFGEAFELSCYNTDLDSEFTETDPEGILSVTDHSATIVLDGEDVLDAFPLGLKARWDSFSEAETLVGWGMQWDVSVSEDFIFPFAFHMGIGNTSIWMDHDIAEAIERIGFTMAGTMDYVDDETPGTWTVQLYCYEDESENIFVSLDVLDYTTKELYDRIEVEIGESGAAVEASDLVHVIWSTGWPSEWVPDGVSVTISNVYVPD